MRPLRQLRAISVVGRNLDKIGEAVVRKRGGTDRRARVLHASTSLALLSNPLHAAADAPIEADISGPTGRASGELVTAGPEDVELLYKGQGTLPLPLTLAFIACPFYLSGSQRQADPAIATPDFLRKQVGRALDDIFNHPSPFPLNVPEIRDDLQIFLICDSDLRNIAPDDAPEYTVLCQVLRGPKGDKIEASRRRVQTYCQQYGLTLDGAIVFSGAPSAIPTGWFGTDALVRRGLPFELNGWKGVHAFFSTLPGVVAISRRPIRPLEVRHELLHCLSAYNSGQVLDEYDSSGPYTDPDDTSSYRIAVNKRFLNESEEFDGVFGTYNEHEVRGQEFSSEGCRFCVPAPLRGFTCIMRSLSGRPAPDALVMQFITDRLLARVNRQF